MNQDFKKNTWSGIWKETRQFLDKAKEIFI